MYGQPVSRVFKGEDEHKEPKKSGKASWRRWDLTLALKQWIEGMSECQFLAGGMAHAKAQR